MAEPEERGAHDDGTGLGATVSLPAVAVPITAYDALKDTLSQLPPPAAGFERVYRGQTRDHRQMLPSGLRDPPLRSEHLFRAYTTLLASSKEKPGADAMNFLLWTRIIAQHYGPGSSFLDVTRSVDVALWFALHQARPVDSRHVFGPPGPFDVQTDTVAQTEMLVYEPTESGVLYVLDVPAADVGDGLRHGVLLDVATAPDSFSSSPRVIAQSACLVNATPTAPGPDLAPLYACPPLPVGRPMAGSDMTTASPAKLFPRPEEDSWYARFVGIPWSRHLPRRGAGLEVKPPIPVSLIIDPHDNPEDLLDRLIIVQPVDVHAAALGIDWADGPMPEVLQRYPLADATCLVLEGPVMFNTPAVGTNDWNEGLLARDHADRVATYDLHGREISSVSMNNLFIELSPLEHGGWEQVEGGQPFDAIRALWLVREGSTVALSYFFQELPDPGSLTGVRGILFEVSAAGLQFGGASETRSQFQRPQVPDVIRKRLYTVLWISRCCSPAPHIAPFPTATLDERVAIVPWFAAAEARLIEAFTSHGARCVVPRMVGTDEEFFGRVRADGQVIVAVDGRGFGAVVPPDTPGPSRNGLEQ
jgi:hypothetical protein